MKVRMVNCKLCGRVIVLVSLWSNRCACGAEYNGIGQMLANRSQSGEETGEHQTDLPRSDPDNEREGDDD